jgi:hypothetical protein
MYVHSHVHISGSLNKQQFIPSHIACLIHIQSRLSSCSISSKFTSSPGTGPVEERKRLCYLTFLIRIRALEYEYKQAFLIPKSKKKRALEVQSVFSHLLIKIFLNRES